MANDFMRRFGFELEQPQASQNQCLVLKRSMPKPCFKNSKAAARISGWDSPLTNFQSTPGLIVAQVVGGHKDHPKSK